jgi:hypothetical protein
VNHRSLDVSALPSYQFSHRSLMWWGMMGMIAIEGMAFALAVAAYFYLWSQGQQWPLSTRPPELLWGSLNVLVLLASGVPNHWTKRAAEDGDEAKMRIGLVVCALFGLALIGIRAPSTAAGTPTPTVPPSGCSLGCTPRTSSPMYTTPSCLPRFSSSQSRSKAAATSTSARTRCTGTSCSSHGCRSTR